MTSSNSETPQSVVFVDSQITDYQAIVAAINPGVKVIVYDGTQDGLAQIAQDLQGVSDLASVDIISHGAADEVQVGTDVLTTSTIPTYAADLAAIGNALAPDGQFDLYGCDVAAAGDGFLTALQQATGRNVAASTDPIGATVLGGTWTLDATTGPTPDALPANSAALQSFDGLLLTTPAQIYFDTYNDDGGGVIGQGNMVEQVTANGSTLVSNNTIINDGSPINPNGPDSDPYPALTDTTGFVVDTALNEYFIASYNAVNYTWTIQEGSLSGGGLTTLYTDPFPSLGSNNAPGGGPITGTAVFLGGLALDAATGELYFAQSAQNYQSGDYVPADTGIYQISVTGGAANLVTSTTAGLSNPLYMTLDAADNLVFFDDSIVAYPGFPAVENLDVANLTTGAVTVLKSFNTIDPNNFSLQGLAIDTANSTLYLTAVDYSTSSDNAIYSIPFSVSGSGSTATASVGAVTTLYSGTGAFQPTDIVVDAQAGIFYTSGTSPYYSPVDDQSGNEAGVFEGSLTGGSTLTEVFAVSSILPTPTQTTGDAILDTYTPQLFLADIAPVVTAGATATFDGGGSAVTLDSGLIIAAGSSATLASATVTLSSGELSSDILSFHNDTNTETFLDGDTITASYSAGVLSLSGTATVADYQTALDQVQFTTSPSNADPTKDGSDTSRTISWAVSDGTSTSTAATSTLDTVHVAPTVTAGATADDVSGGAAVRLDPTLNVADGDSGGNLTGAKVSIVSPLTGDTLSFTAQNNITESSFTNGVLTLTGTATVQQYEAALASITFGTTSSTAGNRTIDWQVSDGSASNGTSTTATSTVDVVVPPVIGGAGNTAQFYQIPNNNSGIILDGGITVTDSVDITSATVTISAGYAVGDDLGFNNFLSTQSFAGGVTISAQFAVNAQQTVGTLTLTTTAGNATAGDYAQALAGVQYGFVPAGGDPTDAGADPSRTITWSVTDSGGQTSVPGSTTTLDVFAQPIVLTGAGGTPTETSGTGPVVADSALSITDYNGTTIHDASVQITSGDVAASDTLTIDGTTSGTIGAITYSFAGSTLTLTGTDTVADYDAALDEVKFGATSPNSGPRTLTWQVNDEAGGNTNDSSPVTTNVDVAFGPAITTLLGQPVNDGTIQLEGTGANVGDTVDLYADGNTNTIVGTGTVGGGTFNITTTATFADGVHTFTAEEFNGSNQQVGPASSAFTVDVDPSAPAITTLARQPVNGGTVELQGTGETGDTVDLYADGTNTIVGTGTVSGGTFDITTSATFADGVHSFTATETDTANLTSTASSPAFTVDIDPNAPAITTLARQPVNGGTVELQGTGETGDTVDLYADGTNTIVGTGTVSGGTFDITTSATFADGVHTFTATETDTANLTSTASSPAFTVDIDPNAPAITTLVGQPLTGQAVELQGTGEAGDTVDLYADGNTNTIVGTGTVGAGGSFDITTTAMFGTGPHTFTATETDAANLASTQSTPAFQVNVVHQAPAITAGGAATFDGAGPVVLDAGVTVSDVDSGGTLAGATVSIGSGLAGDTLEIGGQTNGTLADSGGTISYTFAGSTLTLSGTDTLADYQAALDSITYSFSPIGGDATTGGADTSRTISWQVSDGSASNGASNVATSTLSVPTTPVVTATAPNVNATASQSFTAAQLFGASDAAGEPILTYEVKDESSGPNQGFWVLDGAVLTNGQITTLTAAQLAELSFVAGSAGAPVTDTLEVAASDAAGLGAFAGFTVTASAHASTAAPTVTAANELQAPGLTLAASSLFSGTAFGGNSIVSYEVEDTTPDSGHWIFNGTIEPTNQVIDVTVAQLAQLSFETGYGSDTLTVRANDGSQWGSLTSFTVTPPPNAAPPAGTTDTLVMLRNANGAIEFYDIGRNQVLLDGPLGQINPALQVAGVGGFDGSDTADLLMRDPTTGAFTLYDVSNNNITGNVALGQVGPEWTVSGFGDFSGHAGETDMVMRNANTGAFEVYDISNNTVTSAAPLGQVGLEWQVAGFGDFSGNPDGSGMLLRNSNTGAFEVYDIANNTVTSATGMGQVGTEWQVAGFGDFSGRADETDMLMRNSNTGAFEVYDIVNNAVTFAAGMGQVGLEWTVAGFGDFSGNANETDMLMRNANTGAFELYDISRNTVTAATGIGPVGTEWSVSGVSADPASAPPSQLTQAMASFAPAAGTAAAPSSLNQAMATPAINPLLTTNHA